MPVHDWTSVVAGNFHDFHESWISELRKALNTRVLPKGYYAMTDQVADGYIPDALMLERRSDSGLESEPRGALAVAEAPPQVRFVTEFDAQRYAARADRIAIVHANGDRAVAFLEIVSPGNKQSEFAAEKFRRRILDVCGRGCHVVIADILPPGPHDPRGIHAFCWDGEDEPIEGVTAAEPFGLSAFRAEGHPQLYFERVGLGQPLPDMPLFLTEDHYVNVPLEATYNEAFSGMAEEWRTFLSRTIC